MPFSMKDQYPFTRAGIEALDSLRPGAYGIFNDAVCIYVGVAGDVKAQLLKHLGQASAEAQRIWQNRPAFFRVTFNPAAGLARAEADLIAEYRPVAQH